MTSDPSKTSGSVAVSGVPFMITGKPTETKRNLKLLFYGEHGSGKTTLAGSAVDVPHMRDVLLVDAESGEMTIDDNDRIEHPEFIDRVRVTDFKMVASVQEYLKAHCLAVKAGDDDKLRRMEARMKGLQPEDIETPKKYRTVIIDSLSEVGEFCMYQLLNLSTDMELDIDEMDVAEWPQFRKVNQMMQLVIRAYRDLPMNVILVASAQFYQDETKRKFFAPNMTGKLAQQVQGFMDIVGFLKTGKINEDTGVAPRRLYIQPVGNFAAKNRRSSYKKAFFEDPTMKSIMADLKIG